LAATGEPLSPSLWRTDPVHRLWRAAVNSWNGLRAVTRSEEAFRQEVFVFIIAVPLAFVLASEAWKRLALILVIVLIMIVELLNTAIEKLGDRVSREQDPRMGLIKDLGSAAVGLSLLFAGTVWLLALAERLGLI
jgi:diacylglycerol kinase (ATP)